MGKRRAGIRCFALRLSTLLLAPAKRNIERHGLAFIHRNRSVLLCEAIQTEGHGVSPRGHLDSRRGDPTGRVTPARIQVAAGTHTVTLRLDGFTQENRTVSVDEGQTVPLNVALRWRQQ